MFTCTFPTSGSRAAAWPQTRVLLLMFGLLLERDLTGFAAPLPSPAATFAGNAQHTANYPGAAQDLNAIRWQAVNDANPSATLAHYGSPIITAANTVLVPAKNAAGSYQVDAYDGSSGGHKYTLATDYLLPAHNWIPSYNIALANHVDSASGSTITRLYFPGVGGTIYYADNPDSTPSGAPQQIAFYGLGNYQANASAWASSVFINTPVTADSQGNVFFGFRVQGTAPAPLSTGKSGFARITPDGIGSYTLVNTASGDSQIGLDSHNSAPALSADESTLYVAVKASTSEHYGYLLGLNAATLALKNKVFLVDPRNGNGAGILDDSTASPTVGPDGDVYFGVMSNPNNGSRGFLLHFSGDLTVSKVPGAFGWDYTAAIVPVSMVPSYTGTSPYLIFSKYNNYAIGDGDGVNRIALLDPNATQTDAHPSASGLAEMREVLTVIGSTPDSEYFSSTYPNAVREWCINTAAVNPDTKSIFTPSEDGHIYRWDLVNNSLAQSAGLSAGLGEPYVPTVMGPDGTVFTLNGGNVFALGTANGYDLTLASANPDVRTAVTGQAISFTVTVKKNGAAASGSVTLQDVYYPSQSLNSQTSVLASNVALDGNGQAAFSIGTLGAGSHFLSASYDAGSGVVARVTRIQRIHSHATTTTVAGTPNPSTSGQSVTVSATVTSASGSAATGQVTFLDGGVNLAQVPLNSAGSASFSIANLSLGSHTLTAAYASDSLCASSSGTGSLTVQSPGQLPSKPSGLQASSGPGRKQISLKWQANPAADTVTGYEVWRSASSGGPFTRITTVTATSTVDSLKASGTKEFYYIIARNASGPSVPSDTVSGTSK